jgi:hypothetical protein
MVAAVLPMVLEVVSSFDLLSMIELVILKIIRQENRTTEDHS